MSAFRDAVGTRLKQASEGYDLDNGQSVFQDDADAVLAMPEMEWLKQFLVDTLNTDFLSDYQCELVGDVPPLLLAWADIDADWNES